MIQLRVLDILEEQHRSKYWLFKRMDMSYQNFNNLVSNRTSSIRFSNIEKLCTILNCPVGDLFVITDDFFDSANNKKITPNKKTNDDT